MQAKNKKIVVLQRGWVVVGDYEKLSDTEHLVHNASVIRYWGTTKGLGELALEGPKSQTKLDPAGIVRFHPLSVVMTLDTEAELW